MNVALVERIADAVLYEGYILYPYRPSTKNRQRWTFGGLLPDAYCRAKSGEASSNQTECLVRGTPGTSFDARVRFLHLTDRLVGEYAPPLAEWPGGEEAPSRLVESLRVGDKLYNAWQEAEPREVRLGALTIDELMSGAREKSFAFPRGRRSEPVLGEDGKVLGVLIREQQPIEGAVEVEATTVGDDLFRVTLRVACRTPMDGAEGASRDEALLRALVSTHAIIETRDGQFVSLMDPPEEASEAAAACRNVGVWPVLVGEAGEADTMLASPIILYDYPQIAAESPGDFFDGTEIDEMLTLRIMTLTDEEKGQMASVDERTRALLARTEATAREQLHGLHGTVRGLQPKPGEGSRHA
ncbi:MAG TPA: hypothetical protein VGH33_05065 [Isosphaeraceae bacterium]